MGAAGRQSLFIETRTGSGMKAVNVGHAEFRLTHSFKLETCGRNVNWDLELRRKNNS